MPMFEDRIRFGVHMGQQDLSLSSYVDRWRAAESLGYDWASVFDHFRSMDRNPEGPCFESTTLLAGLAVQTTRIRCAILATGNTYRNPAVLAKAAVTIDHLSGGRLELVIGAGWFEAEHHAYGIEMPPTGQRIRMLGESAKILKSLWTQHRTTFHGRYYTITDALCEPKPLQKPHIPLWVGGMGEKLTLRVAAESADGWTGVFVSQEEYLHKLDVLAGHCRDVGRDPADIRKSVLLEAVVGETEKEAEERGRRLAAVRKNDLAWLKAHGIVGTPEQCVEQLMPYVKMGVDDFLITARVPAEMEALELVAKKIAPVVKEEGQKILAARR